MWTDDLDVCCCNLLLALHTLLNLLNSGVHSCGEPLKAAPKRYVPLILYFCWILRHPSVALQKRPTRPAAPGEDMPVPIFWTIVCTCNRGRWGCLGAMRYLRQSYVQVRSQ